MFDLADDWVWDFWVADDGEAYHLFFLKAPRSLGDPDLRHRHASVGHATSRDLTTWTRVADALGPQPEPAFDSLATWTGCCVRGNDGTWRMFTTGLTRAEQELAQRVGVSTSPDLLGWERSPDPLVVADRRWYATRADGLEEHWRDPWVVRDATGTWHMYVTAQAATGAALAAGRGVVGHATSHDLEHWEVRPALSSGHGRFDWLEVISLQEVDGRWVLLFSCLAAEMPGAPTGAGGVWCVSVDGPGAPVDLPAAVRLTDERWYVGKLVQDRAGAWQLLAFRDHAGDGVFVGGIDDPVPVRWRADGRGLEPVPGRAGDGSPAYG